ncbi:Glycosyl transferase, group 1 [Fulvivirga imtechensis AK7]|uniref:Glycosyl transferase, group 1 n=1 Tax=Fulvivirga imtechensis AK7 TaxID=1237149 RepID=L8JXP0_9BACT|nr:glycosyltransferase [Fulvivirga imtechensis]ELR71992.1 Glycosyl transferase, group 1 [Fulvivirga imtechensis AK7]
MISGRDIVVIGIQPWDYYVGSNCKNIAEEFAKHNRVLYVNEPLNRITSIRDKQADEVKMRQEVIRGQREGLVEVGDNIWTLYPKKMIESINWLPRSPLYNYLNRRNNRIFYKEIKETMDALSFKDVILFNDSLIFLGYYAVEMLCPALSIYYIRDNLVSQDYFARHGADMEPQLAKKYDAVVANSDYLANYLKPYNQESYMVGQGCDFSLFDLSAISERPNDIKDIPGPIVGYLGFLTSLRLDIGLMEHLATSMKEGSLVLVGPEDDDFKSSRLHNMENVYFLGNKKGPELPAYIAAFDVAINPQEVNDLTIGNYPRKVDEYLAMGKAVVATYTEAMDYFKDHVYLSRDKEEFAQHVQKALQEDSPELAKERILFAKSHTWENNVKNIYKVMSTAMEEKVASVNSR